MAIPAGQGVVRSPLFAEGTTPATVVPPYRPVTGPATLPDVELSPSIAESVVVQIAAALDRLPGSQLGYALAARFLPDGPEKVALVKRKIADLRTRPRVTMPDWSVNLPVVGRVGTPYPGSDVLGELGGLAGWGVGLTAGGLPGLALQGLEQGAGEALQQPGATPESVAVGAGTQALLDLDTVLGFAGAGKTLKWLGLMPADLRPQAIRDMAAALTKQGVATPPSMRPVPVLDAGGHAAAVEAEQARADLAQRGFVRAEAAQAQGERMRFPSAVQDPQVTADVARARAAVARDEPIPQDILEKYTGVKAGTAQEAGIGNREPGSGTVRTAPVVENLVQKPPAAAPQVAGGPRTAVAEAPRLPPGTGTGQTAPTTGREGPLPPPTATPTPGEAQPHAEGGAGGFLAVLSPEERTEAGNLAAGIRWQIARTGVDVDILTQATRLGWLYFKAGATKFAAWWHRMAEAVGPQIRRHLWGVWARVKRFHADQAGTMGEQPRRPTEMTYREFAEANYAGPVKGGIPKTDMKRLREQHRRILQAHLQGGGTVDPKVLSGHADLQKRYPPGATVPMEYRTLADKRMVVWSTRKGTAEEEAASGEPRAASQEAAPEATSGEPRAAEPSLGSQKMAWRLSPDSTRIYFSDPGKPGIYAEIGRVPGPGGKGAWMATLDVDDPHNPMYGQSQAGGFHGSIEQAQEALRRHLRELGFPDVGVERLKPVLRLGGSWAPGVLEQQAGYNPEHAAEHEAFIDKIKSIGGEAAASFKPTPFGSARPEFGQWISADDIASGKLQTVIGEHGDFWLVLKWANRARQQIRASDLLAHHAQIEADAEVKAGDRLREVFVRKDPFEGVKGSEIPAAAAPPEKPPAKPPAPPVGETRAEKGERGREGGGLTGNQDAGYSTDVSKSGAGGTTPPQEPQPPGGYSFGEKRLQNVRYFVEFSRTEKAPLGPYVLRNATGRLYHDIMEVAARQARGEPGALKLFTDSEIQQLREVYKSSQPRQWASDAERKAAWDAYLKNLGYAGDEIAETLASTLHDPAKASPEWFTHAVRALRTNRDTGGQVWKNYLERGELDYGDVRAAIVAYERHAETDYDELLAKGYSQDDARALMRPLDEQPPQDTTTRPNPSAPAKGGSTIEPATPTPAAPPSKPPAKPPAPPAAGAVEGAKQPWEMTREEFANIQRAAAGVQAAFQTKDGTIYPTGLIHDWNKMPPEMRSKAEREGFKSGFTNAAGDFWTVEERPKLRTEHPDAVKQAVAEGLPVPTNVLRDYSYTDWAATELERRAPAEIAAARATAAPPEKPPAKPPAPPAAVPAPEPNPESRIPNAAVGKAVYVRQGDIGLGGEGAIYRIDAPGHFTDGLEVPEAEIPAGFEKVGGPAAIKELPGEPATGSAAEAAPNAESRIPVPAVGKAFYVRTGDVDPFGTQGTLWRIASPGHELDGQVVSEAEVPAEFARVGGPKKTAGIGNREPGTGKEETAPTAPNAESRIPDAASELSPDEARVMEFVTKDPISIDQLTQESGLPAHKVSGALTMLELKHRVKGLPGGQFVLGEGEAAAGAEAPVWVREGQKIKRLLDTVSPARLSQAATAMKIREEPAVAHTLHRLSLLSRARADFEGAGRKMVPEQEQAYTPLLDWLRGARIPAWKGVLEEAEIAEAAAGRAALKKFFEFKTPTPGEKPTGGYLDQVVEEARADPLSGFKGDTTSELLDQMTREADVLEQGGKKSLTELLDHGDEKARAMAESIREALADEEAARKAVIDAIMPHVTSGRTGISEAELRRAVGKVEARAVEAEAQAAEAQAQAAKAEAALEELERKNVADVEAVRSKLRLEAAMAGERIDARRKYLVAELLKLPIEVRQEMIRRGLSLETAGDLQGAIRQACKYFDDYLKGKTIDGLERTAAVIMNHRRELDPSSEFVQEMLRQAGDVIDAGRGKLKQKSLHALKESLNTLVEGWHWHKNSRSLYELQGQASAEDAARTMLAEMDEMNPPPGIESRHAGTPETPQRSIQNRVIDANSTLNTIIERDLGPTDGVASTVFVDNIGTRVAGDHYRQVYEVLDPMNAAATEATGGHLGSEKDFRWKSTPLTFEIGGRKVTAERRFWLTLRAVLKDADAAEKWLLRTEGEYPEPATAVWSTRRGRVALSFGDAGAAYGWADAFDAADPRAAAYIDKCLAALNEPGRFDRTDATHFKIFGTHIEKVPGTRTPTQYNVAAERRRAIPDFSEATPQDILKHMGHHKARLPGGRGVSMVIGDFDNVILGETWRDAAFNSHGPPLRDGWTMLEQTVEHGVSEKPVTLRVFLGERVGAQTAQAFDRQLRHVAQWWGLAYQTMLDKSEVDSLFRRGLHNAVGAAVTVKITPPLNQIPAIALPLADTRSPMHAGDLAAAIAAFPSEGKANLAKVKRLRPDIRWRGEVAEVQQFMSSGTASPRGYGSNRLWRRIKKAVAWGGRPMIYMDVNVNRTLHFMAARRQLLREGMAAGEALDQRAADMAADWMHRVDAPLDPAYETLVGQAAQKSTAVAAVTSFMKGKIANLNVSLRAIWQYKRDRDAKKLAYRLAISVIAMAGAFTAVGVAGKWLSGRGGPTASGVAGDLVENAFGNAYGATEAIRLIRSPSSYGAHVISSPPLAALERAGQGFVGLHNAIYKGSPEKALTASLDLIRGTASLAGIPTDQAVNLARFVRVQAGGAKAAKPRGRTGGGRAGGAKAAKPRGRTGGGRAGRGTGRIAAARTPRQARPRTIRDWFAQAKQRKKVQSSRFKVQSSRNPAARKKRTIREWWLAAQQRKKVQSGKFKVESAIPASRD